MTVLIKWILHEGFFYISTTKWNYQELIFVCIILIFTSWKNNIFNESANTLKNGWYYTVHFLSIFSTLRFLEYYFVSLATWKYSLVDPNLIFIISSNNHWKGLLLWVRYFSYFTLFMALHLTISLMCKTGVFGARQGLLCNAYFKALV